MCCKLYPDPFSELNVSTDIGMKGKIEKKVCKKKKEEESNIIYEPINIQKAFDEFTWALWEIIFLSRQISKLSSFFFPISPISSKRISFVNLVSMSTVVKCCSLCAPSQS